MIRPKFWTFDHPILDNLPAFDAQKIPDLVTRVQQNDPQAKEELLNQSLSYIKTRLNKLLYQESRLRNNVDELISYLIEWLVTLINQVAAGKELKNFIHLISASLYRNCLRYLDTLTICGPIERSYKVRPTQCNVNIEGIADITEPTDLIEDLQDISDSKLESEFIRLRIEGYRNFEIAKILNLTQSDISRIRTTLLRKLKNAD